MSSRTIEARAVISASDRTGSTFDRIASKFRSLEKNAKAMESIKPLRFTGNLEEELRRLKLTEKELQSVRRAQAELHAFLKADPVGARPSMYFRAMDDWKSKTVAHWREVKAATEEAHKANKQYFAGGGMASAARWGLGTFGALGGAYAVGRMARAGIKANAEGQRETARDYLAGLNDAESQRLKDEALRVSGRYQSVDATTMHERLRDTAMSTRSVDKALELSDTIAQMTTVLQSLKGKDKAVEEGRKFFAALDVLGKNIEPKEVRQLAEGYVKALGVEGADMDLAGVLTMSRRLKAAGATVSNRFLMTTGVGLARDLGDDRAGNSISMMMQQEAQATKQAKAYGQKFGLRDNAGKFVDRSMMMSDPDFWAWKNITAAMKRANLDPEKAEDVNTFLQSAYSNSSARDVISKVMTQRAQYEGKAEQYPKAPGLEAAATLPRKDPFVAANSVIAQLNNLASQAPIMDGAAKGLGSISSALAELNKTADLTGAGKFIGNELSLAARDFKNIASDISSGIGAITRAAKTASDFIKNPISSLPKSANESPRMGGSRDANVVWSTAAAALPYVVESGLEAATYKPAEGHRTPGAPRLGGGRFIAAPSFPAPEVSQTMTYGTGAGGGGDRNISVSGEVTGEAQVKVTVEAGSSLIEAKQQAETAMRLVGRLSEALNGMNANGPGTTGRSSPDAAAPSVPHVGSLGNSPL